MKIEFDDKLMAQSISNLTATLEATNKKVAIDAAYEIISEVVDKLLSEAVKRAPIREGMLTDSLTGEVERGNSASTTEGYVYIPANSPASDYALYMHESHYNLGPVSASKQSGQSAEVGRKYLERAFDENQRAFALFIIKKLRGALKS